MILGSNPCADNSGKLRRALTLEIAEYKRQNELIGNLRESLLLEITNNRRLNESIRSHQMELEIANEGSFNNYIDRFLTFLTTLSSLVKKKKVNKKWSFIS